MSDSRIDVETIERDRHLAREAEWAEERSRLRAEVENWQRHSRKWEARARRKETP